MFKIKCFHQITTFRWMRTTITLRPETASKRRALKIAVIGPPNVGKSAITNEIIKADLCAVSKKMDTTRSNTVAAITENSCQLVVVDSPGLVGLKHAREAVGTHSESSLLTDPERAISTAEHLLIIHVQNFTTFYYETKTKYFRMRPCPENTFHIGFCTSCIDTVISQPHWL